MLFRSSFLIRSLRYLNGRTLSPFPTEAGQINLRGVSMLIREGREIPKDSDSHIIFARVLDSQDPRGLWIETNRGKHEVDPTVKLQAIMIPWREVLSLVVRQDLSPEVWEQSQVGFMSQEPKAV